MAVPSAPKGTRDFYPEEIVLREHIFASWHKTCQTYGFELFDAPTFEHLEIYTQKSGAEIEKQLYAFEDKAGRRIALRPELTPSLARMVAARGTALKMPLRWYSIPRLFRYEKMQKGRLREFFQLNMDILGSAEITADAELIAAVAAMMHNLSCTADDFAIHVSSRTLLEQLFLSQGVTAEQLPALYALLDRKDKVGQEIFEQDLGTLLGDSGRCSAITSILSCKTLQELSAAAHALPAYTQLQELFALSRQYGIEDVVQFDIGIVRGLAYYTGTVFEVFDKRRSMRAIAGGGRYDKLVGLYGGPATPAVGFAAGDVVLADLLMEKGLALSQPPRSQVFVVTLDESLYPAGPIGAIQQLRDQHISAEYALRFVNVGKQLKLANAARCPLVVFIGGDEQAGGLCRIKDMRSGQEQTVAVGAMVESVKGMLG
jgi:histidyl-tRNA synthetase